MRMYGHKGSNQYTKKSSRSSAESKLSQQDQDYLDAHENEVKLNQQIMNTKIIFIGIFL